MLRYHTRKIKVVFPKLESDTIRNCFDLFKNYELVMEILEIAFPDGYGKIVYKSLEEFLL